MVFYLVRIAILILGLCSLPCAHCQNAHIPSSDTVKIMSWNLHLLPSPVFARSKKKLRTDSICEYFSSRDTSFEVLMFQEVFHKKRRKQLVSGLQDLYPFHTTIVNPASGKIFKTNSGLLLFSKTPITPLKTIQYNDCSGNDCMAHKGAQLVRWRKNEKSCYLINTHLNSELPRSIALEQLTQIKDSLLIPLEADSLPFIVGGDFNIDISDSTNYVKALKILKTKNKKHVDITHDSQKRKVNHTLDYLMVYDVASAKVEVLTVYKFKIGPSWINSNSKKIYGKTVGFSDHYPVAMELILK